MPQQENLKYKKNFLTNVICRIDFVPISQEIIDGQKDKFKERIKQNFPNDEKHSWVEFFTTIKGQEKIDERKESFFYNFFDTSKEKKVTLTYKHVAIEFLKYKDFTDFKTNVKDLFDVFMLLYKPTKLTRLGLRYINQIFLEKGNPFSWKGQVDSSLMCVINKFLENNEDIARAMSQAIIKNDDYTMNFNYGIFNSEFPAKIRRKEFILDFDCSTQEVNETTFYDSLAKFNKEIKILFEKSIKDNLRELMEVINE